MVDENSQNAAPQPEENTAAPAEANPDTNAAPAAPEKTEQTAQMSEQTATQEPQTEESAPESTPEPAPEAKMPTEEKVPTTAEERTLAAIGYLPLLGFITVTLKPDSKYCNHHGNQGIAVTILWFVVIVWLTFEQYTGSLAFLALFALTAIGMFRGFKGDMWKIPVIAQIAEKINLGGTMKKATGVEKSEPSAAMPEQPAKEEETVEKTDTPQPPETPAA